MDETPETPHPPEDDQATEQDSVAEEATVGSSDPSALLASAAAALKDMDDPAFEGTSGQESADPESAGQNGASSAASAGDYGRAVLAIETPVAVVLAKQKISLERVVNLVPGSMLTFEAHCDEPLTLEAGGHAIAVGETVKIGDKFGLRIRQLMDSME